MTGLYQYLPICLTFNEPVEEEEEQSVSVVLDLPNLRVTS